MVEEKEEQEEPRGQEAQEHWHSGVRDQRSLVSPPCPPLQRANSFQDDSASHPSPTGSYLLETPQLQPNPCSEYELHRLLLPLFKQGDVIPKCRGSFNWQPLQAGRPIRPISFLSDQSHTMNPDRDRPKS